MDLGLIYGVEIEAGRVSITMTLTSQGCPLHETLVEWVRRAVSEVPGVDTVQVAVTFDPPWTPLASSAPRAARSRPVGSGGPMRGAVASPWWLAAMTGVIPGGGQLAASSRHGGGPAAPRLPAPALHTDTDEGESPKEDER